MKINLPPANAKIRALLKKLEALAERGIDGEKASAQRKIARLKARYDFRDLEERGTLDLFSGTFKRSATARKVCSFGAHEFDVANSVKWAIETATRIPCVFRHGDLMAEATTSTAKRLTEVSVHIGNSFRALIEQFRTVDGVSASDRNVFVMGLYDGMMGETRVVGQRLPGRAMPIKKGRKSKKADQGPATQGAGLHVHPYTVGVNLGKKIRFSAPLEQITAELTEATRKQIG